VQHVQQFGLVFRGEQSMCPTALGQSWRGTGFRVVQGIPSPHEITMEAHHSVLFTVCPNPEKYVVVGQQSYPPLIILITSPIDPDECIASWQLPVCLSSQWALEHDELAQPFGPSGQSAEQTLLSVQAASGMHQPPYWWSAIQNQTAEAQHN